MLAPASPPPPWLTPILDRLRLNARHFGRDFRGWLILVLLAGLLDLASTIAFMLRDGVGEEAHPLVRLVSVWLGPVLGPLAGKAGQMLAVGLMALYYRRQARVLFLVVTLLYSWAAWYNVWGRELYTPRLLHYLPL